MSDTFISETFADYVLGAKYEDVPAPALEKARQTTLDTIGVIIGAIRFEASTGPVLELMNEFGGKPECGVFGTNYRLPPLQAAFANGALAHSLDFDDHLPEGHHPSSSTIPPLFAFAERTGGVDGKRFLTAVAVGQDLFVRIRRNVTWKHDWHLTTVIGVFSGVAAAAHLLGLTREQTVSAFGIALAQSSGTYEMIQGVDNTLRGFYAAFVSHQVVLSVLMAQKGVKGPASAFDGTTGFFNVYFDGKIDREAMLKGLGRTFHGQDVIYKPWSSCGLSHTFVWAALQIRQEPGFDLAEIAKIRIQAGKGPMDLCQPLGKRIRPATASDAKFSIPYCVALVLQTGAVTPADFLPEALKREDVIALGEKIEIVPDSSGDWGAKLPTGKVEVIYRSGASVEKVGTDIPGTEAAPMSWDDLIEKYVSLVSSCPRIPAKNVRESAEMIRKLDTLPDVRELVAKLT